MHLVRAFTIFAVLLFACGSHAEDSKIKSLVVLVSGFATSFENSNMRPVHDELTRLGPVDI